MDDQLLIRYITHRCTSQEVKQVEQWILSDKQHAAYLFEMERLWSLKNEIRFSSKTEIEAGYSRLMNAVHRKNGFRQMLSWGKYAAAVAIIVLLSVNLYRMNREGSPGGMNVIEVPKGELASLTLSDGTKVWLNADTRFSYPSQFNDRQREVRIEGEGYFEVMPGKKPFVVKGDLFNVRVLGTTFNIRAHKNEDAEISLKTGQITVNRGDQEEELTLNPNQQICYTRDGQTLFSRQKDMSAINNWSKGELTFYAQSLPVIVKALERKYNVAITLGEKELEDFVFTCRTKSGATLKDVLELLKETQDIDYIFSQEQIIITKKRRL